MCNFKKMCPEGTEVLRVNGTAGMTNILKPWTSWIRALILRHQPNAQYELYTNIKGMFGFLCIIFRKTRLLLETNEQK